MLSAGLPVKVLVSRATCSGGPRSARDTSCSARASRGSRPWRWDWAACSSCTATCADLACATERVHRPVACREPALLCDRRIAGGGRACRPYLTAAAAKEARAFPTSRTDTAGDNWAAHFSLESNRNPDVDSATIASIQRGGTIRSVRAYPGSYLALCDRRVSRRTSRSVPARWNDEVLYRSRNGCSCRNGRPPSAFRHWGGGCGRSPAARDRRRAADAVDAPLLLLWHRLQDMHSSHTERLLAREKAAGKRRQGALTLSCRRRDAGTTDAAPAGLYCRSTTPRLPHPPRRPPTRRGSRPRAPRAATSTTRSSGRVHYNENKQAYIVDINGTYRQLAEAAKEFCQVAIIHYSPATRTSPEGCSARGAVPSRFALRCAPAGRARGAALSCPAARCATRPHNHERIRRCAKRRPDRSRRRGRATPA